MLRNEDIEAGIAKGVITRDQADTLWQLATERRTARRFTGADDERFRFIGGFNDVFLALGVLLLSIGFFTIPAMIGLTSDTSSSAVDIVSIFVPFAALWALAEFITRRRRLSLPSMVAAVMLCYAGGVLISMFTSTSMLVTSAATGTNVYDSSYQSAAYFVGSFVTASLFYLRFRLPFALLLAAGSFVVAAIILVGTTFPDYADTIVIPTVFILGVLIFWGAMSYDTSDPQRLTRRSDCAFWLHILAGPILVHSIIKGLASTTSENSTGISSAKDSFEVLFKSIQFDVWTVGLILAVFIIMSLLALVIDRRAILVSTLIYIGSMIAYFISRIDAETLGTSVGHIQTVTFGVPLLLLGALVIILGMGWTPLRARIVQALPLGQSIRNAIPPVPTLTS